jgi:hypothetical protein
MVTAEVDDEYSYMQPTYLLWYFCKFSVAPTPILHQGQGGYGDCGGG